VQIPHEQAALPSTGMAKWPLHIENPATTQNCNTVLFLQRQRPGRWSRPDARNEMADAIALDDLLNTN
jgi:hypothetical protein